MHRRPQQQVSWRRRPYPPIDCARARTDAERTGSGTDAHRPNDDPATSHGIRE
jgi:hypothetical protein